MRIGEQYGMSILTLIIRSISVIFLSQKLQGNKAWLSPSERALRSYILVLLSVLVVCGGAGCTTTVRTPSPPRVSSLPRSTPPPSQSQVVVASWYGPGFQGRKTASGERFHSQDMTAAHRSLPLGSHVT